MVRGTSLELVGIVERDPRRQATLLEQHGVPCSRSLDELLAVVQADCALICTPDQHHFPDAMSCLQHGLHVLIEKPMCPTLDEARSLLAAFRDRGRILASGMVERHNPAWPIFLQHVPELEGLRRLEIVRSGRTPAHRSSGVLRDLAIHDLDLLWSWLGPLELDPRFRDEGRTVSLRGASAPGIHLVARWDDAPPCRRWTLEGRRGTLVLDLRDRTVILSRPGGFLSTLQVPPEDPLDLEHRQFTAVIRNQSESSLLEVPRHLDILAFCERVDPTNHQ